MLVVVLSILLSLCVYASDGGEVPSTEDAKEQNGSYLDPKEEEPEETVPEKEPEESVPATKPQANVPAEEPEEAVIKVSLLKESVKTDFYEYDSQTKTLEILKDNVVLTGDNENLSLKFKDGILHVTFRDLIVAQTEKELISYNNGQALWIELEGDNKLLAEKKFVDGIGVMFHGRGKVDISGDPKAFKDNEFGLGVQDARVTITTPVEFKDIDTYGDALVTLAEGSKFRYVNDIFFAPEDFFAQDASSNISDNLSKGINTNVIWVILVPLVLIIGFVIALIHKKKAE